MRKKTTIIILLFVFVFAMADTRMPVFQRKSKAQQAKDTVALKDTSSRDTLDKALSEKPVSDEPDTTKMDSLQLAVYRHNKAIDDSIRLDSINKKKKNGVESPVKYSAADSLVYDATKKMAYLYGQAKVDYQNMNLESERMRINMDSSTVYATGAYTDSTNTEIGGKPVFVMGQDKYENDTIKFNFKSKKGIIQNVRTEQEDGFLFSKRSKRTDTGEFYLEHGTYTTCDAEHPDFYISLSRAKVRPGKDVVFGPAYLVVCDVPLPLAIPYGFFPFTKSYSSGFIMPSYGDESTRGFYLRDGGYYFAINDKWDLKLLGEIYTKGSWGISAASNYRKRYKYSGSFLFSYQNTKNGEKGMPDYLESESFKLQWSHRQDSKANPYSSLSASVNFATSNFERNNLTSLYNPQSMTQSTRTSSINYSTTFSSIGMSLNATANINQNMRDSSVNVTLPDLNISISPFRPFKRKHAVGAERWYEKIQVRYTGQFSNSIHTKEDQFMKSNLLKDWKKGAQHTIPINANFTLFDYINVTPSFNFTDRMYTDKVSKSWDEENQVERADTTYGFYNVYNWNLSLTANTKLYGMWIPNRKLFGDKIQAIRHVFTPQIGFSYAPDFGSARYGYYQTYQRTDENGDVSLVEYSPYSNGLFTPPGKGKTGSISFDVSNNIEMKIKSEDDSTGFKKISIIDELGASMSYNMSSKDRPWSDLSMRLRLKWWKSYTFNLSASFATYAYELDDNGKPYIGNHTEYSKGRFGRFQGMSQQFSVTIDPSKLKKWFGGGDDKEDDKKKKEEDDDDYDTGVDTNIDDVMERGKHGAEGKGDMAETDADGYMRFSMPWSLSIGYGISMRENTGGEFNTKHMRYPYKFSQNLNFSGNIRLSEGWNINFTSGYDFNAHELSMTTASLSRDLHCFNMSCSVVLAPHTSYNFSFRCNASTLTDALKYDKRSGYTNAIRWY